MRALALLAGLALLAATPLAAQTVPQFPFLWAEVCERFGDVNGTLLEG